MSETNKKWAYLVLELQGSRGCREERLDNEGEHKWELVSVSDHRAYFKRTLIEGAEDREDGVTFDLYVGEKADEDLARLRRDKNVVDLWEKSYRGWRIIFGSRKMPNSASKRELGFPAMYVALFWYSRRGEAEYGETLDNDYPGGFEDEQWSWELIERSARDAVGRAESWGSFRERNA